MLRSGTAHELGRRESRLMAAAIAKRGVGRDNAGAKEAAGRGVAFTLPAGSPTPSRRSVIGRSALGLLRRDARQMLVVDDVGGAPHGTRLRFTVPTASRSQD
jgi:hypothetical protein